MSEQNLRSETENEAVSTANTGAATPGADGAPPAAPAENPMIKKRIFGRGIYGSKDVPIRVLDACIVVMVAAALVLLVVGTMTGGFKVNFDTGLADVSVAVQTVRHGNLADEPETPLRPGYTLAGWSTTPDPDVNLWDFTTRIVQNDLTLYAIWRPAEVTVTFDAGEAGTFAPITVIYGEPYGVLPIPVLEGKTFAGWVYSGQTITPETTVTMTGEHVLQATWQ